MREQGPTLDLFRRAVTIPVIQQSLNDLSLIGKPAGLHACHCQEHLRAEPWHSGHDWQHKVAPQLEQAIGRLEEGSQPPGQSTVKGCR